MQKIKYHHVGIPTDKVLPQKDYIAKDKLTASGYFENVFGIEWLNFDNDCEMPDIIKKIPHVAFVVENLDEALKNKKVIVAPNSPAEGVRVAFIEDQGAPIEFLEFSKPESEIWRHDKKLQI